MFSFTPPFLGFILALAMLGTSACSRFRAKSSSEGPLKTEAHRQDDTFKKLIPEEFLSRGFDKMAPGATNSEVPTQELKFLATSIKDKNALRETAHALGVKVHGDVILELSGTLENLKKLEIAASEDVLVIPDATLQLEKPDELAAPDAKVYYLAHEDFGLPAFFEEHPVADGRGTIIGIVDDGVSLFQSGLTKTSTGERKIKGFRTAAPELNIVLQDEDTIVDPGFHRFTLPTQQSLKAAHNRESFAGEASQPLYAHVWTGTITEPSLVRSVGDAGLQKEETFADWNENGIQDSYQVAVGEKLDGRLEVCVDLNGNNVADVADASAGTSQECVGEFRSTGEVIFWKQGSLRNLAGSFDLTTHTLSLTEGERSGDSHGEGVASVAAGYQLNGDSAPRQFDGVAPGAQLLDYDLSARSASPAVLNYTIGTFTRALEWLGKQKADVVNVSYSLFFQSVEGQLFMQRALDELVQEYNFVLCLSGGNNGPGLASLNRRAIYPPNTMVAGAFVGKKLYEYVHGTTGLPEQGRVVSYSSRGPGPFGDMGPTLISPLASLTHAAPGEGFRAFSGTSSASPALAGFASVLLSAVLQENLPQRADLIVQAMRLSGAPLAGVPFIEQGAGLPKMAKALEVYRKLVSAELPARLQVAIPDAPTADSYFVNGSRKQAAPAGGIFLRHSQLASSSSGGAAAAGLEFTANLKAVLNPAMPADQASNMLYPLDLEYTADWVTGPAHLFASLGSSSATITVLRDKANELFKRGATELFAEVKFRLANSEQVLWTLPVTFVKDAPLIKPQAFKGSLGTEESKRHHFFVPEGTEGIRIQADLLEGSDQGMSVSLFNPAGVRVKTFPRGRKLDLLVPLKEASGYSSGGWYQLAVTKSKGGEQLSKFSARVSPVQLTLLSEALDLATGIVRIENSSGFALEGALEFRAPYSLLKTEILRLNAGHKAARFAVSLRGYETKLALEVSPLNPERFSYFDTSGHSCIWNLIDESEKSLGFFAGGNGAVLDLTAPEFAAQSSEANPSHRVRRVDVMCTVFENDDKTVLGSDLRISAKVRTKTDETAAAALDDVENWSTRAGFLSVTLNPGINEITLPGLFLERLRVANAARFEIGLGQASAAQPSADDVKFGELEVLR